MASVRDLLDGCVDGRYVAPERRAREDIVEPTIETVGGEVIVNFLVADRADPVIKALNLRL